MNLSVNNFEIPEEAKKHAWYNRVDKKLLVDLCNKVLEMSPGITLEITRRGISCRDSSGEPKKFLAIMCAGRMDVKFFSSTNRRDIYPLSEDNETKGNRKIETYKDVSYGNFNEVIGLIKDCYELSVGKQIKINHSNKSNLKEQEIEFKDRKVDKEEPLDLSDLENFEKKHKEGAEKQLTQTVKERNPQLRKETIEKHGNSCMICGFNFNEFYGDDLAKGYIEVHHTKPLAEAIEERETSVDEMVVVCSNCHRVLHRKRGELLDWKDLKEKAKKN